MTPLRIPRETIWSHGRKGDADWMRVLVDPKQLRVEVKYKDGRGKAKKEVFQGTEKAVQAKAIRWAEAFKREREKLGRRRSEVTHAELWKLYQESPAWSNLREKSKPSYTHRWNQWVRFRGATTKPDDTTLHHFDRFQVAMREQGIAENQIRNALNVARIVYNWGESRELVQKNAFKGFRWSTPKVKPEDMAHAAPAPTGDDDAPESHGEYTEAEYEAILAELGPQDSRRWRAHVMLLLAGYHGQRGHALTHLRDRDIRDGKICWPAEYQKNGRALEQPLTWEGYAAILTARHWRAQLGYTGPWLLPAGAGVKRGQPRELRAWEQDPKHKRVGTGKGTPRRAGDEPYSYSGAHAALIEAEKRAKVTHMPRRAFHGFRKMSAGNVFQRTGNVADAMTWIGDDIRQAPVYLKTREERMQRLADAASSRREEGA